MSHSFFTARYDDLKYTPLDIGARITQLRKQKNMSMYALALNSGLDDTIILRSENGEREPKIGTLLKIIDGLEISTADFFKVFTKY
ncbi:putative XRE family transcriptional regulators [Candidatus Termititenax persephonae]|uniref:XRE family transcriptional regulators n=1 Tax=Candidatus Termititenax persephonae TaxID=2218525 RepID=A0A388TGP2_9BACT|nr:putative XRE family transcriptional regulators [Candidatus Termititenax persephonae]